LKKSDFVNNTTSDKSRAFANKAETVQSDITLGRNYPYAGYTCGFQYNSNTKPIIFVLYRLYDGRSQYMCVLPKSVYNCVKKL